MSSPPSSSRASRPPRTPRPPTPSPPPPKPPRLRRKKKIAAADQGKVDERLKAGRDVYNFRCYFCHGYSGDGKTVAADMLQPKPRDFTKAGNLTVEQVLKTLRMGIPGTAMKRFEGTLSHEEMEAVAAFVIDEFVVRKAPNTAYHTAANGWPDHRQRYGQAYPFVLGQLTLDHEVAQLADGQRQGRALYLDACVTCHEPRAASPSFEAFPLSHMGQVVREPVDHVSRASVYGLHDRPLDLAGLTVKEELGRKLYDDNCAFCHARDGTGKNWIGSFLEPHPRNFTDRDQTAHLSDERLRMVIREGLEGTSMPAWGSVLTEDEIGAVIAYVRKAFLDRKH